MPVTLPLSEMTVSAKLEVMEILWQDLSRNADALESPAWHKAVLDERERKIQSGKARFIDWEEAKADLPQTGGMKIEILDCGHDPGLDSKAAGKVDTQN